MVEWEKKSMLNVTTKILPTTTSLGSGIADFCDYPVEA